MKAKTKLTRLNAWLLLSVHNFDDIPVRLFHSRSQAIRWLRRNDGQPPKFTASNETLGTWDVTGHLGWKLLEFKVGCPVGAAEVIKWGDGGSLPPEKELASGSA